MELAQFCSPLSLRRLAWLCIAFLAIFISIAPAGYLPDEKEVKEDTDTTTNFTFSDSGTLTAEDLDEYLNALHTLDTQLKNFDDPYSPTPLSDESLGIPSEFAEEPSEPLEFPEDFSF